MNNVKRNVLWLNLGVLILCGCTPKATAPIEARHETTAKQTATEYTDLLTLQDVEDGTLVRIRDPWHQDQIVAQYLLHEGELGKEKTTQLEERYGASCVLNTPLHQMAVTSACHAWLLSQLGGLDKVAVLCDTAYIASHEVQAWMRSLRPDGTPRVADGGTAAAPNAEVLMAQGCDAVWVSPMEGMGAGSVSHLPIPIIYCADYMETSPLGRAEWMKFYGRLVGKGKEADALFARIATRYESLTEESGNGKKLLAELPYGATWYVPGGCSTSALLYQDAGYDYPWANDCHPGSLALSREAVLAQAADCDLWIIKYHAPEGDWSLADLLAQNKAYQHIQATSCGEVWGCNTAVSDFYDVTPFRPDSLLQSLKTKDGAFFHRLR